MKKPYIARDTKQPLVVLGGYQIAADGSIIREPIKRGRPLATRADYDLLEQHGWSGLEERRLFGVIDRLKNPANPEKSK